MNKLKNTLLMLLILALSVFLLAGCGDNDDSSSSKSKKDNDNDASSSSSITYKESALDKVETEFMGITDKGDYIIKLRNNNNKGMYIEHVTVNFFNESGIFEETATANDSYFCIPANKEIVTFLYGYGNDFSKYSKSEIELSTGTPFYEYRTKIDTVVNNTGSQIAITLTNNTDIDLDSIRLNVVFTKNRKVVGINYGSTDYGSTITKNGGKSYLTINYPYDNNFNEIDFDDFEAYIVSAYADKN